MPNIDTDYLERPVRVLLIEDNPGDVRLLQTYMQSGTRLAYDLTVVHSLEPGIDRLRQQDSFDLVFLDLNLPDSQGLETLYQLLDQHLNVPIIILTGVSDGRLGIQAVKAGAQDYLLKGPQVELILERTVRYALERHRLQRTLRELALRDDLTQLYNRRGLRTVGETSIELSRRKGFPITMLFIDVVGMKHINDTYGHPAGDKALQLTADLVRGSYRASDVVARVGGDEFVILALDCGQGDADMLRQRLLTGAKAASDAAGLEFDLRLSVGVVCTTDLTGVNLADLLADADQAMYESRWEKAKRKADARRAGEAFLQGAAGSQPDPDLRLKGS